MSGEYQYEEKENFEGKKIKVLGPTYDKGKPEAISDWRLKLVTKEDKIGYLRAALRYWYSKEWYGSEKRKQEA
ncbi:MAG TPA: hypothetical protein PLX88_02985 [Syntrophorhabdaceae bacterium]|nr:hypothetical protein [Syntrophorhabdaceae bacterium]MDI9560584.1 hypothetical protein [Pseudomonadota bacterium]OQC48251.1 MAG: hypothetical protein BWX58_01219 [Deltaproteobacteria bacterium ADurb.Bin026]MBP8698176.1 hypothetical protein [Syntrophorhabdaceae bacterium]MBV6506603.1 hypothetical protein [Syntrophorhabdaceae bacterium]